MPKPLAAGGLQSDVNGNLKVTIATLQAGEDITNDITKIEQRCNFINLSADTLIKTGSGRYYGFQVNSTAGGSFILYDNTAASGTKILNTVTPAIGIYGLPFGVNFSNGLYIDITGTIDITVFYI